MYKLEPGKTLAYLLAQFLKLGNTIKTEVQLFYPVPTRELLVQVAEVVEKTDRRYVNKSFRRLWRDKYQYSVLVYEGVDILVGTPGRVMDLMKDAVLNLKDLKN